MNNFFEDLKNQISTFCICADSFKFFSYLVVEKLKDKVLACFHENTPSSNPLERIGCCGIQEAACDFVNCSVSRR
jgi:hypothetical protein